MSGSLPPSARPAPRRRALRGLAVAVCTLLLADLGTSLLLLRDGRFLGQPLPPFGAITEPSQERWVEGLSERDGTDIGRFDAELGWDWIPGSRSADELFSINADGARGRREYAPRPAQDTLRLVAFGDSFTFCDEVPDDRAFGAQLEARDPRLEVLNFGVGGYGTDQALLRFRRLGRERGARVVLVGILLENIGRNVNRYRPLWSPRTGFCATKPRFVLAGDALELVPQPYPDPLALQAALRDGSVLETVEEHEHWSDVPPLPTGRWSSFGRLAGLALAHRARSPERLWRDVEGEPFQVSVALLETFRAEALASGAEHAPVLLFPARKDLDRLVATGERYWQPLLDALEARGVEVLDLSAPLAAAQQEIDAGRSDAELYWGSHLSGAGNFIVAGVLHAWLRERGLLPSR